MCPVDLPRGVPSALWTLHALRSDDIARQRQEAGGVAAHLRAEWTAICQGRRNLMLAGSRSALDAALAEMMPQLLQPVARFDPETEQSLPQPAEGTLVLMEAAALTGEQQF